MQSGSVRLAENVVDAPTSAVMVTLIIVTSLVATLRQQNDTNQFISILEASLIFMVLHFGRHDLTVGLTLACFWRML